jgi:phosphocarrier protein HPr
MNPTETTPPGQAVVKELVVLNKLGIHARPAAMIVRITNKFKSEVFVEKDEEQVNGKSIMGLMMLAAGKGLQGEVRRHRRRRPADAHGARAALRAQV